MDLITLDETLQAEYRRITGSANTFEYLHWITAQVRVVVRSLSANVDSAWYQWGGLTKAQRREMLLRHLRGLPPASWPDLRLVHPPASETVERVARRRAA